MTTTWSRNPSPSRPPTPDPDSPTPDDTDGPGTPPEGGEPVEAGTDAADRSDPVGQPRASSRDSPRRWAWRRAGQPYRARLLTVRGTGDGEAGRRSRALTSVGRTVGAGPDRR